VGVRGCAWVCVGVRPRPTQVPSHKGELRTFSLIAKGKEEMEGWLAALRAAVARADQKLLQARHSASAAPLRALAALGLPGHCGCGAHGLGGRAAQFYLFVLIRGGARSVFLRTTTRTSTATRLPLSWPC
jgi:hypothetical protein